jgi:hypothetical protein
VPKLILLYVVLREREREREREKESEREMQIAVLYICSYKLFLLEGEFYLHVVVKLHLLWISACAQFDPIICCKAHSSERERYVMC